MTHRHVLRDILEVAKTVFQQYVFVPTGCSCRRRHYNIIGSDLRAIEDMMHMWTHFISIDSATSLSVAVRYHSFLQQAHRLISQNSPKKIDLLRYKWKSKH